MRAESGDREEKQTKTSSLPTPQLPTCDLKEVDQWIRDPQNPNVQLFGLTELSGAGGTQPMFKTAPAPIGKGVVILPTTTAIPPIRSQFWTSWTLLGYTVENCYTAWWYESARLISGCMGHFSSRRR